MSFSIKKAAPTSTKKTVKETDKGPAVVVTLPIKPGSAGQYVEKLVQAAEKQYKDNKEQFVKDRYSKELANFQIDYDKKIEAELKDWNANLKTYQKEWDALSNSEKKETAGRPTKNNWADFCDSLPVLKTWEDIKVRKPSKRGEVARIILNAKAIIEADAKAKAKK